MYNWLLATCYLISGGFSEFTTRLPAMVPLFVFAIVIFYSASYFLRDKRIGALSGISSLIYGRMISYDSMIGHIDILYSCLTFSSFMTIFYFFQKKKWFLLFFVSYVITAITFLMKGLPSIVFQGITLITLIVYTKNFRKLFSWQHIVSGIFCLLLIGLYFYNYSLHNPDLATYFDTMWDQSSQRTALQTGALKTVKYILLFPFDQLWQLFPASLLLIFCLHRNFIKGIRQNQFLTYCSLIFITNILVYWASPETRPRYILMLYPLLLMIWAHAYYSYRDRYPLLSKIFNVCLIVLCSLVTLFIPAALFAGLETFVNYLVLKVIIVFSVCLFLTLSVYRSSNFKMVYFLAFMIMLRLAFSWFVLPHRFEYGSGRQEKELAINAGNITKGQPFYLYQYHPHVLSLPIHHKYIFYIERERMQSVKFTETDSLPGYYFTFDRELKNPSARLVKSYQNGMKLFIVQ